MTPSTPAERRRQTMALPPLDDADDRAIARFLDATRAESGLAAQSLASYRRDLEGFARWAGERPGGAGPGTGQRDGASPGTAATRGGLAGADRAALFDYLAWRSAQRYSPRSTARLLSTLRA